MNIYRVRAYKWGERPTVGREYIVLAPDRETARELALRGPHDRNYDAFRIEGEIYGSFEAAAQVLGHCESGTWIWVGP